MGITQSDIASNVTIIGTIISVAEIISFINAFRQLGAWIWKCKLTWWKLSLGALFISSCSIKKNRIYSLLKEAKVPANNEQKDSITEDKSSTSTLDNISIEERQLLGRYGVWLLVGRCSPTEKTPEEVLGRLLAMLFHWFHVTESSLESNVKLITF